MTDREQYAPGCASGAQVVTVGTVKLTTVGVPAPHALAGRLEDHIEESLYE
jgi:hypothetical protein